MISGANRGIGRAIAERLMRDGYTLSLGARDPETLAVLNGVQDDKVLHHEFDARAPDAATRWVDATRERFGRIDALVNNAGVVHPFDVEAQDETPLDEMWEVNVKGPLRLVRAAYTELQRCGSGRVINIVSLSGKRVKSAAIGGYAMSKHAAAAFNHALRHAGWEHGIRATSICPGFVATDMTAKVTSVPPEEMIQPEAVAHMVSSLLVMPNSASVSELPINCVLEPLH
ncbi:MAG: SDR family NAD(P)-dependent oxidoreductase [Gammaproteobacteria bacterium]|nr:SDR family NAD(P)-dependent oxidoreductase [Gammaproteobacteria bacterium]